MQLRKAITPRARVNSGVMDMIQSIAIDRWSDLEDRYKERRMLSSFDKKIAARIQPLVTGDAMERVKADLHGLPYEEFDVFSHRNENYLVGRTRPIVCLELGRRRAKWDLGQYTIYIPSKSWKSLIFTPISMLPERDPWYTGRHFHHTGFPTSNMAHPVDMSSHWCASQFSSIMTDLLGILDFAGEFRILHRFLSSYYANSPLTRQVLGRMIEE